MKISFHAFLEQHTINEHWIRQIVSSFRYLRDSQQIARVSWDQRKNEADILNYLYKGEIMSCLKMLIKYNLEKQIQNQIQMFFRKKLLRQSVKID